MRAVSALFVGISLMLVAGAERWQGMTQYIGGVTVFLATVWIICGLKTTLLEVLEQGVRHYDRMIEWVESQAGTDVVDPDRMREELGEWWVRQDCALCQMFDACDKGKCPILLAGQGCLRPQSYFNRMTAARTWADWLKWARQLRDLLATLRDEEKGKQLTKERGEKCRKTKQLTRMKPGN